MRITAHILSYLFHPIFIISYVLFLLIVLNPYLFAIQDDKAQFLLTFSVVMLSVFFPLVAVALMKMLGLVKDFTGEDRQERIGPLVATGIFYLWLFVNVKDNTTIPDAFTFFVLGCTIALFLSLLFNSFIKISLHGVGMGGLLAGIMFIKYFFSYEVFHLSFGIYTIQIHTSFVVFAVILIAGLVGTARLLLNAHKPKELYLGYVVGIWAQFIAFRIIVS